LSCQWVAGLHRRAGVDLRLEVGVRALLPDSSPTRNARRAAGAELSDGTLVHADAAPAALGAVPNTAWLSGSGLQIDGGVVVDAWCLPLLTDGRPAQNLVAAGDVTRWPHPFAPGQLLNLGHWSNATEPADAAAATLLHATRAPAYRPVPSFSERPARTHALLRQRELGVHQRRVHEPPRSQHQRRPDQRGRPTHLRAAPSWHLRRPAAALTPPVPPVAPALADDHPAYCAARIWRTATSHWHDSLDCRSCGVSPGDRLPVTKSVTIKEADECRGELVGGFLGRVVAAGDRDPA